MKKLWFVLMMVALVSGVVRADLGLTYSDKVVWRGFNLFDNADGVAPQLSFEAGPVNVTARGLLAAESDYHALERWDAQVRYTQQAGPLELTGGYGYYYYPDSDLDFQEISATLGVPLGPATPRYTLIRAQDNGAVASSWLHVAGLDVDLTEHARCFGEAVYNEGFNPLGGPIDRGWSHALFGAALDVPVSERFEVTPAVYYQHTLDELINPERDQVWFSVGLAYTF